MFLNIFRFAAVFFAAAILVGCGPSQTSGGTGSEVAVMDLSAVARATGEDEVIRQRAEAGRSELTSQLQQLAADLDAQIAAERDMAGVAPNEQQAARIQQMTAQGRQQINQAQQQAQQQASQMETSLVFEFRDALTPIAEEIAASRGIKIVLSNDAYIFWADETIDITEDVISAWNERKAATQPVAETQPEAAPSIDEMATEADEVAAVADEAAAIADEVAAAADEAAAEADEVAAVVDEAAEEAAEKSPAAVTE